MRKVEPLQQIRQFEALNVLFLFNKDNSQVLLLKRAPSKHYYPNFYTGIGGNIELTRNEAQHLEQAMVRELVEETEIRRSDISHLNCDLVTQHVRNTEEPLTLLFWYSGNVVQSLTPLSCTEGELAWHPIAALSELHMIDTAALALEYICQTRAQDTRHTTALAYIDTDTGCMSIMRER